jgi:hypothetical protein
LGTNNNKRRNGMKLQNSMFLLVLISIVNSAFGHNFMIKNDMKESILVQLTSPRDPLTGFPPYVESAEIKSGQTHTFFFPNDQYLSLIKVRANQRVRMWPFNPPLSENAAFEIRLEQGLDRMELFRLKYK